jgi:hypothetical protein
MMRPAIWKRVAGFLFLALSLTGFFGFAQAGNLSDASGSIATGGTSQQLLAASTTPRRFFFFQNISTHTMWLNFGVAAVQDQPSVQVIAGAIYRMDNSISDDVINVISSTTGDKFVCKYSPN